MLRDLAEYVPQVELRIQLVEFCRADEGIDSTGCLCAWTFELTIEDKRQAPAAAGGRCRRAALAVNAELTLLFWRIGHRIYTEVLAGQRAGYGEEILPTLATQQALDYGRGFGEKNLRRMVKFAATFPDEPIVATVSRQLSWSTAGHHPLHLQEVRADRAAGELEKSGIHVAEYLTTLPPPAVLVERLRQATQRAQLQIERKVSGG